MCQILNLVAKVTRTAAPVMICGESGVGKKETGCLFFVEESTLKDLPVETGPHEYRLEDVGRDHGIDAAVFVPFAIVWLRGDAEVTQATLRVRLHDAGGPGEREGIVRLMWSAASIPTQALAVQDRTVTEWAAYEFVRTSESLTDAPTRTDDASVNNRFRAPRAPPTKPPNDQAQQSAHADLTL